MMKRTCWWRFAALIGVPLMLAGSAIAQDEFETWNGAADNLWTNDDNWQDADGIASGAPAIDLEIGAIINSGTVVIDDDVDTAGIRQSGGTIELQKGSLTSEATDFQSGVTSFGGNVIISGGASLVGPSVTFGNRSQLSLLANNSSLEAKEDLSLGGALHFPVTADGSPSIKVGGAASIKGSIVPTFDGVTPGYGNSWEFVSGASSVSVGSKASVVLPETVQLPRGLEARIATDGKNAAVTIGNLPILQVDRVTGAANISNVVGGDITVTGYTINSARGLLSGAGFTGTGTAGFEAPNPNDSSLAEFSLAGSLTLGVGDSVAIGNAYNGGATHPLDEDVTFQFSTESGDILTGLVEYTGPANDVVLNANPETGEVSVYHLSSHLDPVDVTGYMLTSASGSLVADNWTSLTDQGVTGWTEANPSGDHISELSLSSSSTLANGTVVSLGNIYGGTPDLRLQYTTADALFDATVIYGSIPDGGSAPGIPGDIDGDGTVGFPDFLILSANFGQAVDPPGSGGDIDGDGTVAFADFLTLSNNFGQTAAAAAVPEPSGMLTLGLGIGMLGALRRRRRQSTVDAAQPVIRNRRNSMTSKAVFTTLVALVMAIAGSSRTAQAELLGYWPFEDDDGSLVSDFSGNDNHGEGSDTFAFSDDGFQGRAADFGDHNNSAFVAITTAADGAFDSIVDSQQATISFWMNRQEKPPTNQWTFILDGGNDSGDAVAGRQLASHAGWGGGDGTLYFDTGGCCGGTQRINKGMVTSDGTAFGNDGEWHHLAYIRDEETTLVYVDGELFHKSGDGAITSPVAPMVNATIGANAGGGSSHAGLIDEFAIWDEALPLERIEALASGAPPIQRRDPPGDFNLDGVVNFTDFTIMAANFGDKFDFEVAADHGDYNGDLRVNLKDFLGFRQDFNGAAGAAASVPEPSSLLLLSLALVGISFRRRSRQ